MESTQLCVYIYTKESTFMTFMYRKTSHMASHINSRIVKDDCYPYTRKRVNKQTRNDMDR